MSHTPFSPHLTIQFLLQLQIERSLLSAETAWQPADYLPDPAGEGFIDELKAMRECAAELPDELLVVLVGDMITEEALPTYMSLLNTLEGCNDVTGTGESAWARCVCVCFSLFFSARAHGPGVSFSLSHTHFPFSPPICSHSPFFSSTSAEIRLMRTFGRFFSREAHASPYATLPCFLCIF